MSQIVAGVILKYVNFAQGWQPRLLVLQDDTVRYWKVRLRVLVRPSHTSIRLQLGSDVRLNVYDLFAQLRKGGDLKILGLKAAQMEEHGKRCAKQPYSTVKPMYRHPGRAVVRLFQNLPPHSASRCAQYLSLARLAFSSMSTHLQLIRLLTCARPSATLASSSWTLGQARCSCSRPLTRTYVLRCTAVVPRPPFLLPGMGRKACSLATC